MFYHTPVFWSLTVYDILQEPKISVPVPWRSAGPCPSGCAGWTVRVLGQEVWGLQDASGGRALELKAVHLFSNLNGKPRQFWGRDWSHKPPHGFMQGELPERSDSTTAVSFAEERDGGGGSDISSIASGGWTICLPNVLAVSVVEEENATMGDPSGQRGRFCDFTHLKAVFYRWVTAPMLLHPFCTSCSILVKLIGLMYEQNPLVQRLRLMSEFSMISGMSRAETKARFPPLFISLF